MRNIRTCVAIAALMMATPAGACTDWKAVAAFDALILERDKIALRDQEQAQNDPTCVDFRNGKIDFGDDAAKWPKGKPAYRAAEMMCTGADEAFQRHGADIVVDRDAALLDQCK